MPTSCRGLSFFRVVLDSKVQPTTRKNPPGVSRPEVPNQHLNTYGSTCEIDHHLCLSKLLLLGNSAWVKAAAKKYNVLLLDQRGTGLSTAITVQALSQFKTPQEQADYFMQFRADSIVRDSELIRQTLLGKATVIFVMCFPLLKVIP